MALSHISIPPDAARDAKAAELATTLHLWHTGALKEQWGAFERGTEYLITPKGYTVNAVFCSCKDYRLGHICKHIRAVVLADAQKTTKPQPAAVPATSCWQDGCESELEPGEESCWRHANVDAF